MEVLGQTLKVPSPVTRLERKMLGFESELPAPSEEVVTQNFIALAAYTLGGHILVAKP